MFAVPRRFRGARLLNAKVFYRTANWRECVTQIAFIIILLRDYHVRGRNLTSTFLDVRAR